MKKKALAFAAMACSVAMLLSACGGSNSNAASGDTAGSNIITAYNSEPQNPLIPGNTNETGGGRPVDLLFSRLVSFDKDGKASNEVAESITPNDDATQYTIKIKSGWKFTDGTPVTAESFTKAWSYVANAKNAQKCSSFFSAIAGYDDLQKDGLKGDEQLSGLKVVDDTTFTVDLNQSDSVFPIKVGYSAFAPLPESFYKDPKAFGEAPVGNGPYKFSKWDHNKEIALVKNPDYKGNEQPKNDGVTFKVYTDDSAAYRDIQAGNLDVMESVPAAFTKTFKTDKKVQAYSEAGSVIQTFTIPSSLDHFKNDEEGQLRRQAISMAINRDQLIDKVLNGHSPVYYCNWMDIASHTPEYNYTKTWHYLNIDEGQTLETMPRNPKGDVLTAVTTLVAELKAGGLAPEAETEKLKMLIHLVGDMHCPMHTGRLSDIGGNQRPVLMFGRRTNLHSAWDSAILEAGHKWSYTEWQEQIDRLTDDEAALVQAGEPQDWLKETHAICVGIYEDSPEGTKISYDYVDKYTPVIEQQFVRGGYRLARLLNEIYR